MIDTIREAATLLGYVVFVIGAAALGSAGISVLTTIPARWHAFRLWRQCRSNRYDFCVLHGCDAADQCGKLSCPHCIYKFDADAGAFGYPAEGADRRDPASYADHTNYNTGAACHPGCTETDPDECRTLRVRFVDPATIEFESDAEGLTEVRERLPNGDVIHYTRSGREVQKFGDPLFVEAAYVQAKAEVEQKQRLEDVLAEDDDDV